MFSKELKASAWRPSTQSFEALRLYNEGLSLSRSDNQQGAAKSFEAAITEDRELRAGVLGRSRETYAKLGYDAKAEQQSRRAMDLSQSLQPQERYLIAAAHYRITNDSAKGIETYEKLLEGVAEQREDPVRPGRTLRADGRPGQGAGALREGRRARSEVRRWADRRRAAMAIKRGDPKASLQPLNNALSLAIQLRNDEARANVLQAIGVAYKRMGQPAEALKQYQESLAIKRQIGQKRGMAASLGEIAQIQEMLGSPQDAVKSYNEALALQREIGDKSGTSLTLINLGSLLNESLGRPDEALPLFREALSLTREEGDRGRRSAGAEQHRRRRTWRRASSPRRRPTSSGRSTSASSPRCRGRLPTPCTTSARRSAGWASTTRRSRATCGRSSCGGPTATRGPRPMESYSIGTIFDYQGRYGAAVKSKGEALQAFRRLEAARRLARRDPERRSATASRSPAAPTRRRRTSTRRWRWRANSSTRGSIAQVLRFQAESAFFKGDAAGAGRLAGQAVQAASQASDRSMDIWARFVAANTSAAAQPARAAASLAQIARQAETGGLAYLSVYSAVLRQADTLLRAGDHVQARRQVEEALARAETLGLRELQARGEYVVGAAMRLARTRRPAATTRPRCSCSTR